MAESPTVSIWIGRLVFWGLSFAIVFFQLLPLDASPQSLPGPDFLLVVTLAWVSRRPDYAPFFGIALVFFITDLFFQRPPGLWAALVLILTEFLRSRARSMRSISWILEWGTVAIGVIAITLTYRLVLIISLTPTPPLGLALLQMLMTIAVYPLVILAAHYVFRVARPAPGGVDSLGHRL